MASMMCARLGLSVLAISAFAQGAAASPTATAHRPPMLARCRARPSALRMGIEIEDMDVSRVGRRARSAVSDAANEWRTMEGGASETKARELASGLFARTRTSFPVWGTLGAISALALVALLGNGAGGDDWGLLSARLYLSGIHSRVYFEQYSASDAHVIASAGIPQVSALIAAAASGAAAASIGLLPSLWRGEAAADGDERAVDTSDEPASTATATGSAVAPSVVLSPAPATPARVWLLQVAVRRPAAAVAPGAQTPYAARADTSADVGSRAERPAAAELWGMYGEGAAPSSSSAAAADACLALLRSTEQWEAARVAVDSPREASDDAAHRLLSRMAVEEQSRASPKRTMAALPLAVEPQPYATASFLDSLAGEGASEAHAAAATPAVDSSTGAHADTSYLVVTLVVAARAELAVPEAVYSITAAREAMLEIAASLRSPAGAVLGISHFASWAGSRDELYLHHPSLYPL